MYKSLQFCYFFRWWLQRGQVEITVCSMISHFLKCSRLLNADKSSSRAAKYINTAEKYISRVAKYSSKVAKSFQQPKIYLRKISSWIVLVTLKKTFHSWSDISRITKRVLKENFLNQNKMIYKCYIKTVKVMIGLEEELKNMIWFELSVKS